MSDKNVRIIKVTPAPYAAIVVGRMTSAELVRRWKANGISSAVYDALKAGALPKGGHNIWVYRNARNGESDIEVGVQMPEKFADFGDVVCRETPAGEVATVAHFGDYSRFGEAYEAIFAFVLQSGRRVTDAFWEVYGDWDPDPSKVRTDIYHLLEPL